MWADMFRIVVLVILLLANVAWSEEGAVHETHETDGDGKISDKPMEKLMGSDQLDVDQVRKSLQVIRKQVDVILYVVDGGLLHPSTMDNQMKSTGKDKSDGENMYERPLEKSLSEDGKCNARTPGNPEYKNSESEKVKGTLQELRQSSDQLLNSKPDDSESEKVKGTLQELRQSSDENFVISNWEFIEKLIIDEATRLVSRMRRGCLVGFGIGSVLGGAMAFFFTQLMLHILGFSQAGVVNGSVAGWLQVKIPQGHWLFNTFTAMQGAGSNGLSTSQKIMVTAVGAWFWGLIGFLLGSNF